MHHQLQLPGSQASTAGLSAKAMQSYCPKVYGTALA